MVLENTILIIAGTLTALIAGLLYAYSVSVNGGLHRLTDSEYVAAMKSINDVIQNPVFLLSFVGPVILLPLAAFLQIEAYPAFIFLVAASLLYIVGTFGLTIAGNVPLNEKLARSSAQEVTAARAQFEGPWNRLHAIRTAASIAAVVLVFAAFLPW